MKVGEKLVAAGVITEDQLKKALEAQAKTGSNLGDAVASLGFASKEAVEKALG